MSKLGLTKHLIPAHIVSELSQHTLNALFKDGHGISFPTGRTGIQIRFTRHKDTITYYYPFSCYTSIQAAFDEAIQDVTSLRDQNSLTSPQDGVRFYEKYDKRRHKTEYGWSARYVKDGKPANRTFSFGYYYPNPDKMLHGYRTARLFRYYFHQYGTDFNLEQFSQWKHRRLYCSGYVLFDWDQESKATKQTQRLA